MWSRLPPTSHSHPLSYRKMHLQRGCNCLYDLRGKRFQTAMSMFTPRGHPLLGMNFISFWVRGSGVPADVYQPALICSIGQFPWCKCSHHGCFETETRGQLSQASVSWSQDTTEKGSKMNVSEMIIVELLSLHLPPFPKPAPSPKG